MNKKVLFVAGLLLLQFSKNKFFFKQKQIFSKLGYLFLFLMSLSAYSVNYYLKPTGNLNAVASWGTNTDGSGTSPTNFTTSGAVFYIRNNSNPTITTSWTVSGAGSKIVLGDGTNPCSFVIGNDFVLTAMLDIAANATLRLTTTGATAITFGILDPTSTVDYGKLGNQTVLAATYGNLLLSGTGTKTFPAANLIINSNLSIALGAKAALGSGLTHIAGSLTLDKEGTTLGYWGSTTATTAQYKNDTFFTATTGRVSIGSDSCNTPLRVTAVAICQGTTAKAINDVTAVTTNKITGTFNTAINFVGNRPISESSGFNNTNVCSFENGQTRSYVVTSFQVSRSNDYTFDMENNSAINGMGYLYKGNFVPGNCSSGGTFIRGDDNSPFLIILGNNEPTLENVPLEPGINYTLVTTTFDASVNGVSFVWNISTPILSGGGDLIAPKWYTAASGGTAIETGSSFNPVGVAGSGLANTNVPGIYTFYVGFDSTACRTAVNYVIAANTVTLSSAVGTNIQNRCINTPITNITYTAIGATGGSVTGLPAGVTGVWADNVFTISGSPTISGTFNYTVTLTGPCGNIPATGTIGVSPVTTGGIVGSVQSVCPGEAIIGNLTLSGNVGNVIRWQKATDAGFSNPTTIEVTNTTLTAATIGPMTTSTYFRAVVQNGSCAIANSNSVLITVVPPPVAATVTEISCSGFIARWDIVPNATTYLLDVSENIDFSSFVSGYTAKEVGLVNLFAVGGLKTGKTYYFRVAAVTTSCGIGLPSNEIAVLVNASVSNIWNGSSWSTGTAPTLEENIVFNSDYTATENLSGCSCQVNSGGITIASSTTLSLVNDLKVLGGSMTFKDKSSLIQTSDAQNTGIIYYERTTPNINRFDYTYYASPVSGQTLVGVSPETLSDKFLSFDGGNSVWVYENSASLMAVGKGYVIRGPQSYHNTNRIPFVAKFAGTPNNGSLNGENVIPAKSYIVGNPYPSAIKISAFLAANPFLEGTIRFWTHNTNITPSGYSSTDYAACNATGCSVAQSGGVLPNGYIGAGQSVLVKVQTTAAPSQIIFNNTMRKAESNNNSVFFKPNKSDKTKFKQGRIWLNFSNPEGIFKQTLIGYVPEATNAYENMFDGVTANANAYADFYSICENKNLVIQGRAFPFDDADIVVLGYKVTIDGNFSIAIDHVDGYLDKPAIYLEDKILNVTHDLKAGPYTFASLKGTYKERFVLRYANKTLDLASLKKFKKDRVLVSTKEKTIKIETELQKIKEVFVYNISGKLLYQKSNVDAPSLSIEKLQTRNQVLLLKILLDDGFLAAKKIIF